MLTFKDSITFLASQLCRNRQQMMSLASWMDADPDPAIDKKENAETSLMSCKITHGAANASVGSGPLLLWKMVYS